MAGVSSGLSNLVKDFPPAFLTVLRTVASDTPSTLVKSFAELNLTITLLLIASPIWAQSPDLEVAPYTVVESKATYEVRDYPARKWVSTDNLAMNVHGEASRDTFYRLFDYIDGQNADEITIDMTSPVTTFITPGAGPNCESEFTMSFYIPAIHQDAPIQPAADNVYIQEREAFQVVATQFSGFATSEDYIKAASELYEAATADGLNVIADTYYTAGYDAPYTIVNRRNEASAYGTKTFKIPKKKKVVKPDTDTDSDEEEDEPEPKKKRRVKTDPKPSPANCQGVSRRIRDGFRRRDYIWYVQHCIEISYVRAATNCALLMLMNRRKAKVEARKSPFVRPKEEMWQAFCEISEDSDGNEIVDTTQLRNSMELERKRREKFPFRIKMPRPPANPTTLILQFGGYKVWSYSADSQTLFCKLCTHRVDVKRKSMVAAHVQTAKHKRNIELLEKGQTIQQQTLQAVVKTPPFVTELAKMMVSCNIPLYNADKPEFVNFIEKYTKTKMPSRSKLTKCMEEESEEILKKIKSKLSGKDLVLQVDETTDSLGRSMTAILAAPLDGDYLDRPYLIHVVDIVSANNVTLQQAVVKALHKLFGDEIDYDKVKLLLTDAAAYCIKAARGLKELFPNLLHVTCIAHGLSRVAELARVTYPKVNLLISETKKVFVKSGTRKREFAASCQIPLPPEPIITR
eukprot:snap_masked-scaffold184_size276635-processed-gene-1.15 protein:Tk08118 transcript:snap_masked-scaffold184_size276635-processed-gene-1.15-mRNA-1 annotation:"PREDICTED: uncharacterized protein LOC100902024"